jgi:hypothetical protein
MVSPLKAHMSSVLAVSIIKRIPVLLLFGLAI